MNRWSIIREKVYHWASSSILFTKITSAQNEVALSHHRVRGYIFGSYFRGNYSIPTSLEQLLKITLMQSWLDNSTAISRGSFISSSRIVLLAPTLRSSSSSSGLLYSTLQCKAHLPVHVIIQCARCTPNIVQGILKSHIKTFQLKHIFYRITV